MRHSRRLVSVVLRMAPIFQRADIRSPLSVCEVSGDDEDLGGPLHSQGSLPVKPPASAGDLTGYSLHTEPCTLTAGSLERPGAHDQITWIWPSGSYP